MGVGKKLFNVPGETIEVIIRDHSGARIEKRICKTEDSVETIRLGRWLYEKYGIILFDTTKAKDGKWLDIDSDFLGIK